MVSVIIPLHNLGSKGDYCLKRCLDSILSQTYNDYEVLLMENGSTDDTVEVAKSYCQKDSRFKLHILDTVGISNAKIQGMKIIQGDYICFIDGDDTISTDFFEQGIALFNSNNIDFVAYSWAFYYEDSHNIKPVITFHNTEILVPDKNIRMDICTTMWAKLIKVSFLKDNNIIIEPNKYTYEDYLFGNEIYLASKKIALSSKGIYYYTQNRNNQTTKTKLNILSGGVLAVIDKLDVLYKKYDAYDNNVNILASLFINLFIGSSFAMTPIRKMKKKDIYYIINSNYDKIVNFKIDNANIPLWQKVWFRRFQNAVAYCGGFGGYLFIKFMRFYRNIFIQPFKIKWYK